MDLKAALLTVADRYCGSTGMSKARVATLVANDGKFFDRIEGGGGFTARTFERAMRWFSTRWPEGTPWPEGIPRPSDEVSASPCEAAD